jgi:RNA polymerase sigma-54 factor
MALGSWEMELVHHLVQEQKQTLSPQLMASLKVLAMNTRELYEHVVEEMAENPVINLSGFGSFHTISVSGLEDDAIQNLPAPGGETVEEMLLTQINLNTCTNDEVGGFHAILQHLDSSGILSASIDEIAQASGIGRETLAACLEILQQLDPPGVCAESLEDWLILQLERAGLEDEVLFTIIRRHLKDVAEGAIGHIARTIGCDTARVRQCIQVIRTLNPKPLNGMTSGTPNYVVPDIILTHDNGQWHVELNDHWYGTFEIDKYYASMVRRSRNEELRSYFEQKLQRVRLLHEAISKRRDTLMKIAVYLAGYQADFLLHNRGLRSLSMADVAAKLEIHPSTLTRAAHGKYIQYPGGFCEIRKLFVRSTAPVSELKSETPAASQDQAKRLLRDIIRQENEKAPLSDEQLSAALNALGVHISRRTVAKYRAEMGIGGVHDRRAV